MIKEAKNIDFYTTGKELSKEDFARISEWIGKDKKKHSVSKSISNSRSKNLKTFMKSR